MNVKKISQFILAFTVLFLFSHSAFAAVLYQSTDWPNPTGSLWNGTFQIGASDNTTGWSGEIAKVFILMWKDGTSYDSTPLRLQLYNNAGSLVDCYSEAGATIATKAVPLGSSYVDADPIEFNFTGSECSQTISSGSKKIFETVSGGNLGYVMHWTYKGGSGTYMQINSAVPPYPHIESFDISTSTATARVKGYWEATTTPYVSQRLSFWQYSDSLGKESYEQLTATTTGNFDFTFDFRDPYAWTSGESSTTPIYSNFMLYASLDQYDETNYIFPYGGTIIDNLDATSTAILTSEYNASDFTSTPRDLALYPEYDCDLTHIMGCFKNALIWTFYPTQDALDSWTSLKTTLETKAPIGYFYSVKNAVGGLSATSTPSFSLTIPSHLKQYFFDPFDTGIAGILWFFFIFHFYKRLKNIQI